MSCKGENIQIIAQFLASRNLLFEDTKRIMSPEMRPKGFGTFETETGLFVGPEFVYFLDNHLGRIFQYASYSVTSIHNH